MNKYDVIVVGAGISGLLCSLSLAKENKKVLLIERSQCLGGNCRSYNVDGFRVDTGVHIVTKLRNGPLIKLIDKYFDVSPKFLPHGHYYVRDREKLVKFPSTLQSLARFGIISKKDRVLLARALIGAAKNNTLSEGELEGTVYDFIKDYKLSHRAIRFIDALCYFLTGKSMKETPTWRILSGGGTTDESNEGLRKRISSIIGVVRNKAFTYHGYPAGGIKNIVNAAVISMPEDYVTIKMRENVDEIKKKGRKFLVATEKGEYESDIVVYTGEVRKLPEILKKRLSGEFMDSLSGLQQCRSLTLWLGLRKKRKEFEYLGSEMVFDTDIPYWAMPVSNYDSHLAPSGMQLVGFSTVVADGKEQSEVEELLFDEIRKFSPGIERDIVMRHVQLMVPEKAALTAGVKFPCVRSPLKGLYFAGTDVDERSMGITRAAYSVLGMLDAMKEDKMI